MARTHVRSRRAAAAAAVVLAVVAAGCEPPPPPVALVVTTTSAAPDHTPGDGVCEATPGEGDCSLPAAVAEANAAPRATVTVPAGEYRDMDLTVTGDVDLNWGAVADVRLGGVSVTVAAGARLRAAGLRTAADSPEVADVEVDVAGALSLDRSILADVDEGLGGVPLTVLAGGGAVVTTSSLLGGAHAVDNAGAVVIDRSSLLNLFNGRINTTGGGTSVVRATLLARAVNTSLFTQSCTGTPATSVGYSHYVPFANGCATATSDVVVTPATPVSGSTAPPGYVLPATSPAVDAIPVGDPLCPVGSVDLLGNPRGVDGDGDGEPGCDIGAVERQP